MLPPIKRVFVPKPKATSPERRTAPPTSAKPTLGFNELPSPDMEEKNSDSVWAEFESVKQQPVPGK